MQTDSPQEICITSSIDYVAYLVKRWRSGERVKEQRTKRNLLPHLVTAMGDSQAWQVDGERKVENATEFSDYAASVPSKAVYRPRRSRAERGRGTRFEPVAAALLRAASCGNDRGER
jgi:hypothetical protein